MKFIFCLCLICWSPFIKAQSKVSVSDITGQLYLQPESQDILDYAGWLDVVDPAFTPFYLTSDEKIRRDDVSLTDGNAGFLATITLARSAEKIPALKGGLRLGAMYARERDYGDFFQNIVLGDSVIDNSISMTQQRSMLRFECHYLLRTDTRKPLFISFGLGSQWGFSLNSQFDVEEIRVVSVDNGFGDFDSESEQRSFESDARNAFTSYIFIPADLNARLGEKLYLSMELRYGLKFLQFAGGPDVSYSVFGLGFGLRFLL